jgi:hypothetical protein
MNPYYGHVVTLFISQKVKIKYHLHAHDFASNFTFLESSTWWSTHEYSGAAKLSGMVERQNPMITKVNRFVCESEHDMQDNKPLA